MGFALKKMLAALLMPLSLVMLLLLIGCCCLWLKRYRSARWLVTGGLLLLLVMSCTAISDLSLLALEEQYPKWNGKASGLALIVVMGASQGDAPRLSLTNRPNTAAVYRLLEAIAVYRTNPGSKLIFSGGNGRNETHAELMAQVAATIGVPSQDILLQTESNDTEEEVTLLTPLVRDQRFAVVTSAAHMPRTIQLFHSAGLYPQAVPTHFLNRNNPHPNWRDHYFADVDSIARAEFAMHEYLGLAWLRVKGWFN
jgi:uncharacterized SAM-binding protein YcdF (DUF218 family)